MAFDREQYEARVMKLEQFARANPRAYRLRVALLAALGYGYVLSILVIVLALLVACIWYMVEHSANFGVIKVLIALGAVAFVILKSLWVQFPRPEGIEITRGQAPELFRMIDDVVAALQARRPHHVLITNDFNAAIVQYPRYGILGGHIDYLILGLPYLFGSPPEHVRGTVAHELGHLSGNHSRFTGRIYRVRQTWAQLVENLGEHKSATSSLFTGFLNWYAPYFSAYTFALARADEYVADRCEVDVVGVENAAASLISVHLQGRLLAEQFWPGIYKQVQHQSEPPLGVYGSMGEALREGPPSDKASLWLRASLLEKTDYDDTHPSLTDRLIAIGYTLIGDAGGNDAHPPLADRLGAIGIDIDINSDSETREAEHQIEGLPLPGPLTVTAAERYLGGMVEMLTERLNQEWRQAIAQKWRHQHGITQKQQQELERLDALADRQPLTADEVWQRAFLTATVRGEAAAIPLYEQILATDPEDARAHFALGDALLTEDNATGIAHIERAMSMESRSVLGGCQTIYSYLRRHGRHAEAEIFRDKYLKHAELEQRAAQERANFGPKDTYLPSDLPPEVVQQIKEVLQQIPRVKAAYLARKRVSTFPERPCFVLAINAMSGINSNTDAGVIAALRANLRRPEGTALVILSSQTTKLERGLQRLQGAQIYRKGR